MNSKPKVSVIIPVYNVEKYLQTCIDSLLQQSLQEIELCFVNDASPDHSLEILRQNEAAHPDKIRVISLETNMRQGGARNVGILTAKGDYIGFVDSDDFVLPQMYEKMYEKANSGDFDAVFVESDTVANDATLQSPEREKFSAFSKKQMILSGKTLTRHDKNELILTNLGGVWGGLWKKDIILKNNIFFPEHLRYEDNYWTILIRCYLSKICLIPESYYCYRRNPTSTIRDPHGWLDKLQIEYMLLEELKRRNLFDSYYDPVEYLFILRGTVNLCVDFLRMNAINVSQLKEIVSKAEKNFPHWRKNGYFKQMLTRRQRLRVNLMFMSPVLYVFLHKYGFRRFL